jgi:uncharacterized protein (DUF433 family)
MKALLEGLSEEGLQTVAENLPITKERIMKALKYYGYKRLFYQVVSPSLVII